MRGFFTLEEKKSVSRGELMTVWHEILLSSCIISHILDALTTASRVFETVTLPAPAVLHMLIVYFFSVRLVLV
jgi:hypothetical protein